VYVSLALGGAAFSAPSPWARRYGWYDFSAKGPPPGLKEFPRFVADWVGDGIPGLIGFASDGLHATDLSLHLGPN
jgi:hypothetical protein